MCDDYSIDASVCFRILDVVTVFGGKFSVTGCSLVFRLLDKFLTLDSSLSDY